MNENDRKIHAQNLGLSLEEFDKLVLSANQAHAKIAELGPFYGKEEIKDPTFRITAEPVTLPNGSKQTYEILGGDFLELAKSLPKLSEDIKTKLGDDLSFRVPLTWRIDSIVDQNGYIRVNEIEGKDGANALMIAEQLAYGLQDLSESTASQFVKTLKSLFPDEKIIKIALILTDIPNYPHTPNAKRFVNFLHELSASTIQIDLIDENDIRNNGLKPDWSKYSAVINETSLSPKELFKLEVKPEQLISAGNHTALVNKGLFALIFDKELDNFWIENLGQESLERLRKYLIPTDFIETKEELKEARKKGRVVKVSWAGINTALVNRSRGVAIPVGDVEQNTEERWELLEDLLKKGLRIVAQDFVEPQKIPSFLRKRGITLEKVDWYNRVCVKYVVSANPDAEVSPNVVLTATEVTLGPGIVPATRECAFTAGKFVD